MRFLELHFVISPPTNQRKVTHPADLPPNFAYKTSSSKSHWGGQVFEHEPAACSPCMAMAVNLSLLLRVLITRKNVIFYFLYLFEMTDVH